MTQSLKELIGRKKELMIILEDKNMGTPEQREQLRKRANKLTSQIDNKFESAFRR